MQDAARKINTPLVKKLEVHSKYARTIIGVINENDRIEFRNATKKVLPSAVTQTTIIVFTHLCFLSLIWINEAIITKLSTYVAAQSAI